MSRTCENPFCGEQFTPRINRPRNPARFCSDACRREGCTLRRLASGIPEFGYPSLTSYLKRKRSRRGSVLLRWESVPGGWMYGPSEVSS